MDTEKDQKKDTTEKYKKKDKKMETKGTTEKGTTGKDKEDLLVGMLQQ